MSLHNNDDEDIGLRRTLQAVVNGVGDLGVYSLLNLVIGCRTFTIADLFLRDKSMLLTADCTLTFAC